MPEQTCQECGGAGRIGLSKLPAACIAMIGIALGVLPGIVHTQFVSDFPADSFSGIGLLIIMFAAAGVARRKQCESCLGTGQIEVGDVGPTPFLWREDRERLEQGGKCRRCNYDLRGNTSGRCPECGTTMLGEGVDNSK